MASEDVLPKELNKLEITHIVPQMKRLDSNLPVQLNPFFENDLKEPKTASKISSTPGRTTLKPLSLSSNRSANQNCRKCRLRRSSESVLDELKYKTSGAVSESPECARSPSSGVLKQTLKKSTFSSAGGSANRRVLLREPVLKALQTCFHPHNNFRRNLLATTSTAAVNTEGPLITKGMSDFRDLIDECRNMLAEDVDFSGRLNQLSLSNRNSKNFTTMQTPRLQSINKSRNNRRSLPETRTTLNQNYHEAHVMSLLHPQPNTQPHNTNSFSPEQLLNSSRCNTTCSQQAGNSATAGVCDDVTIDELASYFDTFVHIPKKMSSMAEMMYI